MTTTREISPAKRKRLVKTYGSCPAGYTGEDLERFLDLLYGIMSHPEFFEQTFCGRDVEIGMASRKEKQKIG